MNTKKKGHQNKNKSSDRLVDSKTLERSLLTEISNELTNSKNDKKNK